MVKAPLIGNPGFARRKVASWASKHLGQQGLLQPLHFLPCGRGGIVVTGQMEQAKTDLDKEKHQDATEQQEHALDQLAQAQEVSLSKLQELAKE
ncbi:MAG: hypothetical protein QGH41_02500, partial [Roseibacillus sp.]|nr:hypothetical protein [Roseibacillus sp.]